LAELVPIVKSLLAGEVVDHEGDHFRLHEARLEIAPSRRVPLLVGGNSRSLIRLGAAEADVVEVGGLGRTLRTVISTRFAGHRAKSMKW
jgi:alkanesulfonate monooxygenase SsuD/methylene tetrahydromethanopterin reductase-like flavin-dependent oxidoreductase (luciferase family)